MIIRILLAGMALLSLGLARADDPRPGQRRCTESRLRKFDQAIEKPAAHLAKEFPRKVSAPLDEGLISRLDPWNQRLSTFPHLRVRMA